MVSKEASQKYAMTFVSGQEHYLVIKPGEHSFRKGGTEFSNDVRSGVPQIAKSADYADVSRHAHVPHQPCMGTR